MLLLFDATVEIPLSGFDTAQISSKHTFVDDAAVEIPLLGFDTAQISSKHAFVV